MNHLSTLTCFRTRRFSRVDCSNFLCVSSMEVQVTVKIYKNTSRYCIQAEGVLCIPPKIYVVLVFCCFLIVRMHLPRAGLEIRSCSAPVVFVLHLVVGCPVLSQLRRRVQSRPCWQKSVELLAVLGYRCCFCV